MGCIIAAVVVSLIYTQTTGYARRTSALNKAAINTAGGISLKVLEVAVEREYTGEADTAEYVYTTMKLAPDSAFISLLRFHIALQGESIDAVYNFSAAIDCTVKDPSSNLSVYYDRNRGMFGAHFLLPSPNKAQPYTIAKSDIVTLCFRTPRVLVHDEPFTLEFIPEGGTTYSIEQLMPQTLAQRTTIYKRD